MRTLLVVLCAVHAASCSSGPQTISPGTFTETDLSLPRVVDLNPSPDVVEINLEAKVGPIEYLASRSTPSWTYNGTVPGPLIEARVGDRLVVHFTNNLPEPTTVHWHGIRVPAAMDGTLRMQQPIPVGGTFTYDFVVPEAGLYWYHPHMRSNVQVEKGLYGAILVRGDDTLDVPERVLILDDILLDDQGQPLPTGGHSEEMMGREGNVALVNGHVAPAWKVRAGTWERWRVVNVSNARYYHLTLPGHSFLQVGTDGGWLERPSTTDTVVLTPGERVDLLVHHTGAPGSTTRLTSASHTRGHGVTVAALDLVELRYTSDAAVDEASPVPSTLATIPALATEGAQVRRLVLTEEMGGGGGQGGHGGGDMGVVFKINGEAFPNITPLRATLGATEVWEVENATEMDHPFHLHGFFFQPLTLGGQAQARQWKDTLNIPPEQTLRFAVKYADHAGSFMFHCHILEHAELGMMGELLVDAP